MKIAPISLLAALTLTALPVHADSIQSILSPLPDYTREDLNGCAEAIPFSPETASTVLFCPGVGGTDVTLTVGRDRETLGFRRAGKAVALAAAPPASRLGTVLSNNAGFSGDKGITQLSLEWRVRFQGTASLESTEVLGVIYPVSFNLDDGHGDANVLNYWAVVDLKNGCVTDYVAATGAQALEQARKLADDSVNRSCL